MRKALLLVVVVLGGLATVAFAVRPSPMRRPTWTHQSYHAKSCSLESPGFEQGGGGALPASVGYCDVFVARVTDVDVAQTTNGQPRVVGLEVERELLGKAPGATVSVAWSEHLPAELCATGMAQRSKKWRMEPAPPAPRVGDRYLVTAGWNSDFTAYEAIPELRRLATPDALAELRGRLQDPELQRAARERPLR